MSRVRQSGTSAELIARKLLRSLGYKYSTKTKGLPGTPDLVDCSAKWAIFVHGCFWHAHRGCYLWKIPKTNRSFWREKFKSNVERDKRKIRELKKLGYDVLILWGCELREQTKARRKILCFMKRISNHRMSDNGASLQAELITTIGTEPAQEKREYFHYTPSRKYVVRTVKLGEERVQMTRLKVNEHRVDDSDAHSTFDGSFLRQHKEEKPSDRKVTIRMADLFCGCGGLSLGAREACYAIGNGFESVLAIDNDFWSLEVYKANFNPVLFYEKDIRHILNGECGTPPTANEKTILQKIGEVDILLAGPPCQGHSDLNNHTRRNDYRNGLYERVARFAEIARPRHILIENVPTVIHSHDHVLERTMTHLSECGYKLDAGIVDLSEIGVPQRRKRHVLLASLNEAFSVKEVIGRYRILQIRDVEWAIGDLEDEAPNGIFTEPSKHSPENQKRIDYLFDHDLHDLPDRMRPPCHRNGHTYKSMYGRMKYDEPAQTITSGFGCPGQGRFIHPTQRRALTPHEAARLQFFPDFFDFSKAKTRAALANMIGNAVPMKLSYVFCLEFLIADMRPNSVS